jgi:hypothetical protein
VTPDGPLTEQAIAAACLGLQQFPVRAKRLADRHRMNLQRVFHDNRSRPNAVYQLVFGDKFASRLCQDLDDLEGSCTERYRRTTDPKLAASKVNLALT